MTYCHCGRKCVTAKMEDGQYFWKCSEHGFQGWLNMKGFEFFDAGGKTV
jgi:hypothetical protein